VFAGARLATAVRLTPGGAGVVEALLIGGLVAFGGDPAQVTASVLVFRALTWLLPVPLGALTYLGWRWRQHRRAAQAASAVGAPLEPRSPSA
jgi:putative heme transporter